MNTMDNVLEAHGITQKRFLTRYIPEEPVKERSPNNQRVRIYLRSNSLDDAVSYAGNSIGSKAASMKNGTFDYGTWENKFPFNQIRPCIYKDGAVVGYLMKNDFTKFENGTTATDGDVMIEFPKIYWTIQSKIEKGEMTDMIDIHISDKKDEEDYNCYAHIKGDKEVDFIYISAYNVSKTGGIYASTRGITPETVYESNSFNTFLSSSEGYAPYTYQQQTMLQVLSIILFKSLDYRKALGIGLPISDNGQTVMYKTGDLDKKGMFYGTQTNAEAVKFCGIENFYGIGHHYLGGSYIDDDMNLYLKQENEAFHEVAIKERMTFVGKIDLDVLEQTIDGVLTKSISTHVKSFNGGIMGCMGMKPLQGSFNLNLGDYLYLSNNSHLATGSSATETTGGKSYPALFGYSSLVVGGGTGKRILGRISYF